MSDETKKALRIIWLLWSINVLLVGYLVGLSLSFPGDGIVRVKLFPMAIAAYVVIGIAPRSPWKFARNVREFEAKQSLTGESHAR